MRHYLLQNYQKIQLPLSVWLEKPGKHNFHELPHTHDCYELMLLAEGTGWCGVNDKHYPMLHGDMFLIRPGDVHEFLTQKGIRFYNIMFSPELFMPEEEQFFQTLLSTPGKVTFPPLVAERLLGLLQELTQEISRKSAGVSLSAHALFTHFLVQACRNSNRITEEDRTHHEARTSRLLTMLNQSVTRRLPLAELSRALNLSQGYIRRQVRILTGVSISEYIGNRRMEQAQYLLSNTQRPVSEIAFSLGYFDTPHFDKQFRKLVGCTPLQFRKSFQK